VDHSVGLTAAAQLISEARTAAAAAAAVAPASGSSGGTSSSSMTHHTNGADEVDRTPPVIVDLHQEALQEGTALAWQPQGHPAEQGDV